MNKTLLSASIVGLSILGVACSDPDDTLNMDYASGGTSGASGGATGSGAQGPGGGQTGSGGGTNGGGTGSGGVNNGGGTGSGGNNGGGTGSGGINNGGGTGSGGVNGDGGTGSGGEPAVEPEEPSLVTSGPDAGYWNVGQATEGGGGGTTVTVNVDEEGTLWHGWGGTFNEAGWDALKVVTAEERARIMRLLFHPVEGAGFTYGRIPIGSSDYGLSRYSLNETANDFEMANFSIERDRQDLIPYIKAAMEINPNIRFWASPWSPPTWMKSPAGFDGGAMKSDGQTLGAHALYLARFVEEYETEGIYIEAVHPQNEPGFTQGYPSCSWDGETMANYIANHLGPLFAERLPDREVWLGTMSNTSSTGIVSEVMNNQTARGYVKGIGLQWGMVANVGNYKSYGIHLMQTEHECGNNPWQGNDQTRAPNDHAYGVYSWDKIKNWIRSGVNSYLAWNMVLDSEGVNLDQSRRWAQNALIAIDRGSKQVNVTPYYHLFRHLAQYVDPNSKRVGTQGGDALAWVNPDGDVVTVVYNSGNSPTMVSVNMGGTTIQGEVPGRGWATFNWQGD